jgi:Response regulator containing CheY-like receiver domain and AraC-type DNA-binding domain
MCRILLVDDEVHAVRGLQAGVRWETLGIREVCTAHSMKQAQDVFARASIDVMICDIEMPNGSGLDLLAWVSEHRPETVTVFLTCHSEFAFAQRALQLNCFDYLLKPVDYGELASVVSRALDKRRKERERSLLEETSRRFARLWEAYRPMRKELFWKDIVEQTVPPVPDKIREHAERHHLSLSASMRHTPVYIRVRRWRVALSERDERIMEYALRNAAEEKLCGNSPDAVTIRVGNGAMLVLIPSNASFDEQAAVRLQRDCQEFIQSCRLYFRCELCCYIGKPAHAHEMAEMYRRLQQLDRDNVTRVNEAIPLDEHDGALRPVEPLPIELWVEWLKAGEKKRLLDDLARYLNDAQERHTLDASRLQRIYQDFVQAVFFVLYWKGLQAHEVFDGNLLTDRPDEVLRSVQAFREWAGFVVEVAADRLHHEEANRSVIERVKQYIREQLGELELTREQIARHVYLNPDYLTRLFKKETGMSISDYLQQQRIEYAKHLLTHSDQPVSAVALSAGYANLSYFSTLFKKTTGLTPVEYRRQMRRTG